MAKEVMTRKASDNPYLHKDFHGALSTGIAYLHEHYGAASVREYLRQFALSFYAPLRAEIARSGLSALRDYLDRMYRLEGAAFAIKFSEDEMVLTVEASPAVQHMRQQGYPVAELFSETEKTVNEAICAGTPFAADLVRYDEQTGRSIQRFYRRPS